MIRQFAANLSNPQTNEEYIIVGNTAKEAERFGFQWIQAEAARSVTLEMIVGPLCGGSSYPTGQLVKISKA